MGLFQVLVQRPGEPLKTVEVPDTPWVVGRASNAGLPLTGPGIFDRHLILQVVSDEGLVVEVGAGALARVGGQEIQRHRLRNGDAIHVGNQVLRFVLAPVRRKSLVLWSIVFWALLALVVTAQAVVLIRLAIL